MCEAFARLRGGKPRSESRIFLLKMGGRNRPIASDFNCGTRYYVAPEMSLRRAYGHECDVWSLGVLAFRVLVSRYPFRKNDFQSRHTESVVLPDCISPKAKDLLLVLLDPDQQKRKSVQWALEHGGFAEIELDAEKRDPIGSSEAVHFTSSFQGAMITLKLQTFSTKGRLSKASETWEGRYPTTSSSDLNISRQWSLLKPKLRRFQ